MLQVCVHVCRRIQQSAGQQLPLGSGSLSQDCRLLGLSQDCYWENLLLIFTGLSPLHVHALYVRACM